MHSLLATQQGWLESVLVLLVGGALIVALAAAISRPLRSACLQLAVWRVALVGLVAWLAIEATGAGQAACGLARLAVSSFTVPAAPLLAPVEAERESWVAESGLVVSPLDGGERAVSATSATAEEPAALPRRAAALPESAWPGLIWLVGSLVVAARVGWSRLVLGRFVRRHARRADEAMVRRVGHLAVRLGIRRGVCVLESGELAAPVAFGVWRPSVALPVGFARDFDLQQQLVILAHELAHLAARDPAWHMLADGVCAVLWWHPAAWWTRAGLRTASEAAADDASVLVPEGPSILAGCLVALGRRLGHSRRLVWLSAEGNGFRSGLGRRVTRLLNHRRSVEHRLGRGRLAVVWSALPAVLVLLAVVGTAWARPRASFSEGENMAGVLKTSWRSSLGAVALAALLAPGVREASAEEPRAKEKPPVAREAAPAAGAEKPAPPADREGDRKLERHGRPEGAEGARSRERSDAESIRNRLQEIRERAERLRDEGKTDEAERLRDEARQLMRRGEGMREGFRGRGAPGVEGRPEMAEPMRRFIHLRVAMENLRAAGMSEMADKVREQLETIEREHPDVKRSEGARFEGRPWQRPGRDAPEQAGPEGSARRAPATPELQELRQQMERMHRELQELREQMKPRGERRE